MIDKSTLEAAIKAIESAERLVPQESYMPLTEDDKTHNRAIDCAIAAIRSLATTTSTEPAQATGNPRDWLIDGSLLYRLGDDGANCDEVNVTMIHGSRNQEYRAAAAACLLHVICASEASASPVPRAQGGNTCNEIGDSSPADAGGLTPERVDELWAKAVEQFQRHEPGCVHPSNYLARAVEREVLAKVGASPAPSAKQGPSDKVAIEKEALRRLSVQGMADCMDMVRSDLVEMGIIDKGVAPMFIPEAVANYVKRLAATSASASPAAPLYPIRSIFFTDAGGCRVLLNIAGVYPTLSGIEIEVQAPVAASPAAAVAAPTHDSDCSLHNEPAYPAGPCDCSVDVPVAESQQVPHIMPQAIQQSGEPDESFYRRVVYNNGWNACRDFILAAAAPAVPVPAEQPKPDVAAMVNRFLGWPLPKSFSPDCGISFVPQLYGWPTGTNLFNVVEARALFEFVTAAPSLQQPKTGSQP